MSKANFKKLILFSIFLWVPAFMASFQLFDSLPAELNEVVDSQLSEDITLLDGVIGIVALATLVANISLYFF